MRDKFTDSSPQKTRATIRAKVNIFLNMGKVYIIREDLKEIKVRVEGMREGGCN